MYFMPNEDELWLEELSKRILNKSRDWLSSPDTTMSRLHTVDISTITETSDFRIVSRLENGKPHTVVRLSDNQTVCIDDLVTNGTKMKGKVTGFHATVSEQGGELIMWVDHTWSGVAMALDDVKQLQVLPSQHQFGDSVILYFVSDELLLKLSNMDSVPAKFTADTDKGRIEGTGVRGSIHGIHFYPGKVKYDIDMFISGGASTRIYNIDSVFVFKLQNS